MPVVRPCIIRAPMWPFKRRRKDEFAEMLQGTRLVRETRWSREYQHADGSNALLDSRFRDGSATIGYRQLAREWDSWSDREKLDFCQSFAHYCGSGFAKMLRFIIANGNDFVWQTIATPVALTLPTEEAVAFLCDRIENSEIGRRANYFQGCWITGSYNTIPILKNALHQMWETPTHMLPDSFCNWVTYDAIWCIDALVRLGESKEQFSHRYEQLTRHSTMGSQALKWLGEHFSKD